LLGVCALHIEVQQLDPTTKAIAINIFCISFSNTTR
jgi:hypothetical protein